MNIEAMNTLGAAIIQATKEYTKKERINGELRLTHRVENMSNVDGVRALGTKWSIESGDLIEVVYNTGNGWERINDSTADMPVWASAVLSAHISIEAVFEKSRFLGKPSSIVPEPGLVSFVVKNVGSAFDINQYMFRFVDGKITQAWFVSPRTKNGQPFDVRNPLSYVNVVGLAQELGMVPRFDFWAWAGR